jgi:predicted phage terminase large subunit-like protein
MTALVAESKPTLSLPRLREDQWGIARHGAKTKVVSMGRRWGKSTLGMAVSLACASAGGRVAWIVPTYKNGRPLWRAAESSAARLRPKHVSLNRSERTIDFSNGGFLAIYSADSPDAIRGEAFNLVILDEAAKIAEDVWTDVIQPTLADVDGDAILISTPRGRNWFWREYQRGLIDGREIMSWTAPSSANPSPQIRRAAELAQYRIPERSYRQEWLAEFVEDGTTVFSPTWWADGQNRYDVDDQTMTNHVIARYLSFDTGMKDKRTSDYSACVVGELLDDYRLRIREVWRDRLSFPNLIGEMERLARKWNQDGKLSRGKVFIEDRVSGTSAYQTLSAAEADPWLAGLLQPFNPTVSKGQRASQAGVWCRQDCVLLPQPSPRVPWLLPFEEELFSFSPIDSENANDDQVDALSQMIIALQLMGVMATGFHARNAARLVSLSA